MIQRLVEDFGEDFGKEAAQGRKHGKIIFNAFFKLVVLATRTIDAKGMPESSERGFPEEGSYSRGAPVPQTVERGQISPTQQVAAAVSSAMRT